MGKHLDWKIKYNYIVRYKNRESAVVLVRELCVLGLIYTSNSTENHKDAIYRYNRQYADGWIEDHKYKIRIFFRNPTSFAKTIELI